MTRQEPKLRDIATVDLTKVPDEAPKKKPLDPDTIVLIEEVEGLEYPSGSRDTWDGYKVVTGRREILLLVNDSSHCCETWGTVSSEDVVAAYIGAKLVRIDWLNADCKKTSNVEEISLDCGDVMFVDFVTDIGTLQLAVYNAHNGYYGHAAQLVIGGRVELEEHL